MFPTYDLLALGAAGCWALSSILAVAPARHLGTFAFNRWRMLLVAAMLWAATLATGTWHTLSPGIAATLALSGLFGIFLGDSALFAAVDRLGPRRAGVLFATNAMFSALMGFVLLGERMNARAALGAALTIAGVMTAVLLGRRKEEDHAWETDRGHAGLGVALALAAAFCQAVGSLIAKPVMAAHIDPIAAAAIRVSVACAAHFALLFGGMGAARARHAPTARVLAQTALNGFVGMGLGMTLVLVALAHGDLGVVAILSSVSPVLVLPMLWWRLGRAPAAGAWGGAALTACGTALLLLR